MMPRHWIEALFKKFLLRYGQLWSDRYKGLSVSPDEIADEWASELAGFSPEEIKRGLDACRANKFPPTLPEFISMCRPAVTLRPSADEAWALSMKARDEFETVVWTTDMAQAWGICKPVMDAGDEVGARMAFKAAYERICAAGHPVEWTVSEGFDKEKRSLAMQQATYAGLALPYKRDDVLLVGATPERGIPDHIKKLLETIKKRTEEEGMSRGERDRMFTAQRKAEEAMKVQQYRGEA